jgi:dolichol-phosphate mannosyltransferase
MQQGPRAAPEISIVIPTFNEIQNVRPLVIELIAAFPDADWEVIFVDDNSPDGTTAEVKRLGSEDARIRCIPRRGRRGLAGACIEGMSASQARYVAVMDADLQHDVTLLPMMLESLRRGDAELVVASRYVTSSAPEALGRWRAWMSVTATQLTKRLLPVQLSDPMSGFFAMKREIFDRVAPILDTRGFKILLDVVLTSGESIKIIELPYTFRPRERGQSKLDAAVVLEFVDFLLVKATRGILPVRLVLFISVGASGIAVHLAALMLTVWIFSVSFSVAQLVATFIAMTSNYLLNNIITYRDLRLRDKALAIGWLKFSAICGVGAISNLGVASALYAHDVQWVIAGGAGAVIGAAWNYLVTQLFVWKIS